ncbi:MAG: oxidoreductase [Coriobacteriia bacterium]|nr:oxidoreductase [Coriobacteriia bacterium]
MPKYGILIDYEFCSNCHTCEVICKEEHDIPLGKWGIKVFEVGPWPVNDDKWQLTYVPVPTDLCDLCADRTAQGKLPACVHNCYTGSMEYGTIEDLSKRLGRKSRQVLFVPKED